MKFCVWSGSSFEKWYSSYHLMLKILQEMLAAGHEVWLLQVQRDTGAMPPELQNADNLHVVNIMQAEPDKGSFAKRYLMQMRYYIRSGKAMKKLPKMDAIFLQSNNTAVIPVRFARKAHTPVVYNVQDIFPIDAMVVGKLKKSNPIYIVTRWLQARAYKRADRVVTISEDLATTIRKEGRQDVDVVYNWSYQNEPYNIAEEDNHFLLENGIRREDGFRVVYAGNVGQMMDAEMIVQSAKLLSGYADIKFYIIGEGSNLSRLKNRVAEEDLKNVLFYGRQPMEYAQDNYCMAHVNINPVPAGVMYTCMPSKTATCLLSQKATVVSMDLDSDMAKRLSGVDGWTVVAPGDYQAMADSILKIYESGGWGKLSSNAAQFLQELGPVENAAQYTRILEEAASRQTGHRETGAQ